MKIVLCGRRQGSVLLGIEGALFSEAERGSSASQLIFSSSRWTFDTMCWVEARGYLLSLLHHLHKLLNNLVNCNIIHFVDPMYELSYAGHSRKMSI